jgi:hypothetical protein
VNCSHNRLDGERGRLEHSSADSSQAARARSGLLQFAQGRRPTRLFQKASSPHVDIHENNHQTGIVVLLQKLAKSAYVFSISAAATGADRRRRRFKAADAPSEKADSETPYGQLLTPHCLIDCLSQPLVPVMKLMH